MSVSFILHMITPPVAFVKVTPNHLAAVHRAQKQAPELFSCIITLFFSLKKLLT